MTSSLVSDDLVPVAVVVDDRTLKVDFSGGLQLSMPVSRFPRLFHATPSQRQNWRLIGRGDGIHWPEVDEDISVRSLLRLPTRTLLSRFDEIPALIGDVLKTTQRLNSLFEGRPFTPDGHLVGSIGEVVAEYIYDPQAPARKYTASRRAYPRRTFGSDKAHGGKGEVLRSKMVDSTLDSTRRSADRPQAQ